MTIMTTNACHGQPLHVTSIQGVCSHVQGRTNPERLRLSNAAGSLRSLEESCGLEEPLASDNTASNRTGVNDKHSVSPDVLRAVQCAAQCD